MIEFRIGGRKVNPNNVGDALMRAMLEKIEAQIRENIVSIRDPETGEFPTVIVRGDDRKSLEIKVEGSPEFVEIVRQHFGGVFDDEKEPVNEVVSEPRVFLSYGSEDSAFAERIAKALQANGIDTWWDKWCIRTGDSLRQKIDEGLAGCTHFLVLLTPHSISKPWVNHEMDIGLVRKLDNQCKFLPVRYGLPVSELPTSLSGLRAPEITADEDISQLIDDIHDVNRKPPLGPAPQAVTDGTTTQTGYSPAANSVAKWFVANTENGMFADPQIETEELANRIGLSLEDTEDALYELSLYFKSNSFGYIVKDALFSEFDQYWKPWNPAEDARKLATDKFNDSGFPSACLEIAGRYGWERRRLNPAISYLIDRRVVRDRDICDTNGFVTPGLSFREAELRRFVKGRG